MVVDEADKPVADAEVWVSAVERHTFGSFQKSPWEDGLRSSKPLRDCFATRTAANGTFLIPNLPRHTIAGLAVSKPGKVLREPQRDYLGPDVLLFEAGHQDIKLVVEPAGGIEGKVVAQDTGQPLAGVRLWLEEDRRPRTFICATSRPSRVRMARSGSRMWLKAATGFTPSLAPSPCRSG